MNPEHLLSLKQAAELIQAGKTKPARGLIIDVLREDPDNPQAWYMLSFAVPIPEKQIYALQQTLRIDPTHQKAIDRIKKLGADIPKSVLRETLSPEATDSQPISFSQTFPEASGEDLLSQRLFGEKPTPIKEPEQADPEIVPEIAKPAVFYHEIAEQARLDQSQTKSYGVDSTEDTISANKVFGIPRKFFLIGAAILVTTLLSIMLYSPQLIDLIKNSSPVRQAGINTLENQPEPTETLAPQDTPTPVPPTATTQPTPTKQTLNLFSTADLVPLSEEMQDQVSNIQTAIDVLLSQSGNPSISIFPINDLRLQALIWDFAKFENFSEQTIINQKIFEILGLADAGDDFNSFYHNLWVDPNGTVFIPDKEYIALVGFDFSDYQKFSFAQAYVQYIRTRQFPAETSQLYPPCLYLTETCEVGLAVFKGQAAFTARQWAIQVYPEETLAQIDQTTRKFIYNPIFSPPPVMEAMRDFPYKQGTSFVEAIYLEGGWEAVENLFTTPPITTEQILHPEKYLGGEVGEAVNTTDLSEILPSDWQQIFSDSLGEWKTYLLLSSASNQEFSIGEENAQLAAGGWNGDYAQIFRTSSGQSILTAHWKYDSPADVEEFLSAMQEYASKRFAGSTIQLNNTECLTNGNHTSCLVLQESDVLWVMGTESQTVELILENYRISNTVP